MARIGRPPRPASERFWAKVRITDSCWLWEGARNSAGYGHWRPLSFAHDGMVLAHRFAHRFAYELIYGPIPDGKCVLHRCDVRLCVRPDHLWLGTRVENQLDMAQKGRAARGDRHPSRLHPERLKRGDEHPSRMRPDRLRRGSSRADAKLTELQVTQMRTAYAEGWSQRRLADFYGVAQSTVHRVVSRKLWTHV